MRGLLTQAESVLSSPAVREGTRSCWLTGFSSPTVREGVR